MSTVYRKANALDWLEDQGYDLWCSKTGEDVYRVGDVLVNNIVGVGATPLDAIESAMAQHQ